MIAQLKPFEDRTEAADSAQALIGQVFGAAQQIRSANVLPFNLPPVVGLSTTGGFEYMLVFRLQRFDPGSSVQIGRKCRSSSVQCGFATAPLVFLPGSAGARIIAPDFGDGAAVGGLSTPEVWEHPSEWLKVAIDRRDPGSGTSD
jgi:hypothetical protein